jgi:hypothetical protein
MKEQDLEKLVSDLFDVIDDDFDLLEKDGYGSTQVKYADFRETVLSLLKQHLFPEISQ